MSENSASLKERFLLKDMFNERIVTELAQRIRRVYAAFDAAGFVARIVPALTPLALIERSQLITDALTEFLPKEFPKSAEILVTSLGSELGPEEMGGYDSFIVLPLTMYIARHGLDHFDLSMTALYEMTKRFSSEGAIRYFIDRYPEDSLALLEEWARDENVHVRRLVSEGTRPRLPWAFRLKRFQQDPSPVLPLLERLKEDPSLYVRRSVANHLNDIAKDHPDLAADILMRWQQVRNPGTQWIVRHAARTLVKDGHRGALRLLGYDPDPKIEVRNQVIHTPAVRFGTGVSFEVDICAAADKAQPLMIDYVIHFVKANGKTAPKVFKLAKKTIAGRGTSLKVAKTHDIKAITTRAYYPGRHKVELQVNGKVFPVGEFELLM